MTTETRTERIYRLMAHPRITESRHQRLIRHACEELQKTWSERTESQRRVMKKLPGVDIYCQAGDYWINGLRGIRK